MKNRPLTICDQTVFPGEQANLALPLPELFSCAPMYMPIKIFHGKEDGPRLLLIAAINGNELNGAEIINRLCLREELKAIKGTLIVVPIMNVYRFIHAMRTLPGGVSLENHFPGSPHGSHVSRLTHLFCSEIFSLTEYCIDFQTGALNHTNVPQIFIGEKNEKELALANRFEAPVISRTPAPKGSLRAYAAERGVPYLLYEAGEALRFDEPSIQLGVQGALNVMSALGMLKSSEATSTENDKSFITGKNQWIRSPTSGLSHSNIKLGQLVEKKELLAIIKDPFGTGESVEVRAPLSGIVVSMNNLPLVYEGVELFQLAFFENLEDVASHLEQYHLDIEDL